MKAQLQQRWSALSPRERCSAGVGLALLAAFVLWQWGISPAWQSLHQAPAQQAQALAEWQQMQTLAAQAQALQAAASTAPLSRSATLQSLEAATRLHLGAQATLQPGADAVAVRLENASADALAQWLQALRLNARLLPTEADLRRTSPAPDAPVLWSGSVRLSGPGLTQP